VHSGLPRATRLDGSHPESARQPLNHPGRQAEKHGQTSDIGDRCKHDARCRHRVGPEPAHDQGHERAGYSAKKTASSYRQENDERQISAWGLPWILAKISIPTPAVTPFRKPSHVSFATSIRARNPLIKLTCNHGWRKCSRGSINGEIDCRSGPRQPARRTPRAGKALCFLRLSASQCWPTSSDDTGGRQWRGRGRMPHTIRETSWTEVTAVNLSYLAVSRTLYRAPCSFVFRGDSR
jgi:hypothetical protein